MCGLCVHRSFTEGYGGVNLSNLAPWPLEYAVLLVSLRSVQFNELKYFNIAFGGGDCRIQITPGGVKAHLCYRRRNQWLRLAVALFCLPLTWLARVVYLLVGVAEGTAEGCGGWRGHAYPCAVTGYAMLRYSVGVGVGFLRGVLCQKDEKDSNFIWGVCWGTMPYHTMRMFLFQFSLLSFTCRSVQFSGQVSVT